MEMEKIEEVDLWKATALNAEMELAKARLEAVANKFQAHVDSMWTKYALAKDIDQIHPDGTIVRGARTEEKKAE